MRLTINDQNVSYSLEKERTLGEVVRGVRSWLAAAGFIVTGLSADGRDLLSSDAETWGGAGVETVGTLAVTTTHTGDIRLAHWRAVETWLSMLDEEVRRAPDGARSSPGAPAPSEPGSDGGDGGPLDELLEGLPQTIKGFSANPFFPPGSDAAGRFFSLFAGATASAIRSWPADTRREAEAVLADLLRLIRARIEDASHPEEAIARCAEALGRSMAELKEVSVLLQTGRDRAAMEAVVRFTDLSQSIMDLLPFLAPDPARGRLFAELTPVLKELVAAFDSRDTVLIGDLLEYEVAPLLSKLAPLLGRAT